MHILFVEDDLVLRKQTVYFLSQHQHEVTAFADGLDAVEFARKNTFDVLLCDVKLGKPPNGLQVAAQIRNLRPECPIVMVSNYATVEDMSIGYDIDVDAYLKRPISLTELEEKIYAAAERRRAKFPQLFEEVASGALRMKRSTWTATWHDEPLELTPSEFTLLAHLAERPGHVFSTTDLCTLTKGTKVSVEEARELLKQHIFNLRRKLEQNGRFPQPIVNVRNKGYKFEVSEQ
jgi:DNA-binding response OmpR family regulator